MTTSQNYVQWDENGYSEGLKEKEILLHTRVVQLVDVFDVFMNRKGYKIYLRKFYFYG